MILKSKQYHRFLDRYRRLCSLAAALSIIGGISCNKEEIKKPEVIFPEYILFGQFFSDQNCFNVEACVEIFKMQSGSLLEDVSEIRPVAGEPYTGNFANTLSRVDYEAVLDVLDEVPETLLNMESGMYQTDSNGFAMFIFFEYKSPNKHGYWLFNTAELGLLPTDVQQLVARLQSAVNIASF